MRPLLELVSKLPAPRLLHRRVVSHIAQIIEKSHIRFHAVKQPCIKWLLNCLWSLQLVNGFSWHATPPLSIQIRTSSQMVFVDQSYSTGLPIARSASDP